MQDAGTDRPTAQDAVRLGLVAAALGLLALAWPATSPAASCAGGPTLAGCARPGVSLLRPQGVAEPTVVRGAGKIRPSVRAYRALLGPNNGDGAATGGTGRREINWDGVPDELAAPNALPADTFVARGAILRTPGSHVAVSADGDNPSGAAVRFGDVNPSYPAQFRTFSAERLFSPIGSNVVNLTFVVPGTDTPALVRGFGAVYTDVDRRETAAFEYFDRNGRSLGRFAVPRAPQGLSFLGVAFDEPIVARVRIAYGNRKLGPNESPTRDVAVMDDFIFAEPTAG